MIIARDVEIERHGCENYAKSMAIGWKWKNAFIYSINKEFSQ